MTAKRRKSTLPVKKKLKSPVAFLVSKLSYLELPFLAIIYFLILLGKGVQKILFWLVKNLIFIFNSYLTFLVNLNLQPIKNIFKIKLPSLPHWVIIQRSKQIIERKKFFGLTLLSKSTRLKAALLGALLLFIFYTIAIAKLMAILPSPNMLSRAAERPLTTEIYDRNGKLLYQIYEGRNRKLTKLEEIPQDLINATIAAEDKHFFIHPGVDLLAMIRALNTNLKGGQLHGASTITQQLVKNALLSPEKTYERKIKEIVLSFWAERIYSKTEILQMYFNEVPYGGPAWGITAAAETYFGKKPSELNLAESTYLAGLPAAPTLYSPYGIHPELGKSRQEEVLKRMTEEGYISRQLAQQTLEEPLAFRSPTIPIKAPHFVMYTRSLLAQKYGERTVSQGGLKVTTSIDLDIQEMVEDAVSQEVEKLQKLKVSNGAAMVMDPQNGHILAMVGSKNYFDPQGGNFNATLSLRPPGSSVKVITYATAFKEGFTPGTILLDTPTSFPNPWGKAYTPVNYDGSFHGAVTIRRALGSSYNVPAVKTLAMVGLPKTIQTAKDMGITSWNDTHNYGLSLTLGGAGASLLDMMTVYSTLASGGEKHQPTAILTVIDGEGHILEDNTKPNPKPVLTKEVAFLITNILSDDRARAPAFGAHSLLEIPGNSVAVKTGTSDQKRDNWTFGYTPSLVVGTWVGNFDNSPMDPRLSSGITGAAPIWHTIMANLLENRSKEEFKKPTGIIDVTVNGYRDLGIAGSVPKTVVTYQKDKKKDQLTGKEEDNITLKDQFGIYNPLPSKTVQ